MDETAIERREWLASLDYVLQQGDPERVRSRQSSGCNRKFALKHFRDSPQNGFFLDDQHLIFLL